MNAHAPAEFRQDYLSSWTEIDPGRRRHLIERLWAPTGKLVVAPQGVAIQGTTDIAAHIARVHGELIANKGLTFGYDQQLDADDALLLRWSMSAPSGDIVGRGVDIVFRDAQGKVTTAYMFTGVN